MKIFLQADRPARIETLRNIPSNYGVLIPCTASKNCLTLSTELPHERMLDYSIFGKKILSSLEYLNLAYRFGFDYVLSQDVQYDSLKTDKKFSEIKEIYVDGGYQDSFTLIPIIQGFWLGDYITSAKKYTDYDTIAIGGLLRKYSWRRNADERIIWEILNSVVPRFKRVFLVGVYTPNRECLFNEHGIWAADSKCWQFRYKCGCSKDERNKQLLEWLLKNTTSNEQLHSNERE